MSDVIDTNVVEIRFDNSQFIENVSQTIDSVNNLKEALVFDENSFDAITRASRSVDLSGIATNIESLSERFSTFGIVGMTAIQRITNEVMTLAGKLGSLLTAPWKQIISGGTSRAENISNAQFQLQGIFGKTEEGARKLAMTMNADAKAIHEMTGYTEDMVVAMDAANYAVADTAYGLDSAAKAASVLATSGVDVVHFSEDLKDANGLLRTEMQVALRSISGTAAMANSSYDDVARVFERISGNGRIMAIDLQSLSARGLNAAATLRDYLNEVGVTVNATEQDIREMVTKGKIDFMTFAKAMDSAYGDHAKDANNTFNGAFSNMKFALSKIGADFISPLRDKMIPVLNDVRMVINNIRKALQFKIKFPGTEQEVSVVELFTRAITHLTEAAHDMFAVWMGGQDVITKAMTGLASVTGSAFSDIKQVYKDVENGTISSTTGIQRLIDMAKDHGDALDTVYKTLSENLEKSEDEIREMCRNGEISFEEFSNAISSAFGNTVWDKRVEQLATIFRNVLVTASNLANAVSAVIGPVIEAFIGVFMGKGVDGVISFTQAISDLTSNLIMSIPAQKAIKEIFTAIFRVLKSGLSIVGRLISAAFRILKAISPIIEVALEIVSAIAEVITEIVELIAYSDILNGAVTIVTNALIVLARVALVLFRTVVRIVAPAINLMAQVFNALNRGVKSVKTKQIDNIIDRFEALLGLVTNGSILRVFTKVIETFVGAIMFFFYGLVVAFKNIGTILSNICKNYKTIIQSIVDTFSKMGQGIKAVFDSVTGFIKKNWTSILAILNSLITIGFITKVSKTSNVIAKAIKSWANRNNAEAMYMFAKSIKEIALAFVVLTVALYAFSYIDPDRVWQVVSVLIASGIAIGGVAVAVYMVLKAMGKLQEAKNQVDKIKESISNFFNALGQSAKTIATGVSTFLKRLGTGAMLIGVAAFLLSFAASLYIFYHVITNWASLDWNTVWKGFKNMILIIGTLVVSLAILGATCKKAGGGLMGASIAMLALIVVLKLMIGVIGQYSRLPYKSGVLKQIFIEIATAMLIMAGAVGIMGATCKKAGFGLMGASVAMLALLVILKLMTSIMQDYAAIDIWTFIKSIVYMAATLALFVGAIALMGDALTGETSFSASIKEGIKFKNDTIKFMGIIMTLLALAITFKVIASVMADVAKAGFGGWLGTMLAMKLVFSGIVQLIKTLGDTKVDSKPLRSVALFMASIALLFGIMTLFDPFEMVAAAGSVALVLGAFSVMLQSLPKFKKNEKDEIWRTVLVMMSIVATLVAALAILSVNDPAGMLSAATSISMLALSLSASLKLLKGVKFTVQDAKNIAGAVPVLIALGLCVVTLSKIKVSDPRSLLALTFAMSILGLAVSAMAKILNSTEQFDGKKVGAFVGMLAAVTGFSLFMASSAAILGSTNSTGAIFSLVLAMTAMSALVVALVFVLNLINVNGNIMSGVGAFAALMATITGFALLMSLFAQIGDVNKTIALMDALVITMNKLIPFLLLFSIVNAIVGTIAPQAVLGAAAFAALLGSMALFTALMTLIAWIPVDVNKTTALMAGLVETMNGLMTFLVVFSLVCALIGFVAPVAALGAASFGALLLVIAGFTALMTLIAMIPVDENKTIAIMKATAETLNSMTTTLLILAVVGVLAPLAIVGVTLLQTTAISILALFGIIGAIQNIQNAVLNGVNLILFACDALRLTTEILAGINLGGIAIFLQAVLMLGSVDLIAMSRIAVATVSLIAIMVPIALMSKQRNDILSGVDTAVRTMVGLTQVFSMANALANTDVDELDSNVKKVLNVMKQLTTVSGLFIVGGIVEGMTSDTSIAMLKAGCYGMAAAIDYYFRQVMGIHSNSDWGIDIAKWIPGGILETLTSSKTFELLGEGTTDMAESIKDAGVKSFSEAGAEIGKAFVETLETVVLGATGSLNAGIQQYLDADKKKSRDKNASANAQVRDTMKEWEAFYDMQDRRERERAHDQDYRPYASANFNSTVGAKDESDSWWNGDWGSLFSFEGLFKDIEDSMSNLGSLTDLASGSMDGLADSMGGAGSAADDLTNKIDNLMDEYENRFDTAKERANKDLFKGVDKQGDDFLTKVQDIMDKYKNIYTSAVEQTNSQDLFAEVKEEDESFAPETLLNNLEDQVNQVNELNTIIGSLGGRIADNGLRAAISAMDVDNLPELRALYRMDDRQLREYEAMYQKKVQANQNKIQNELTGSLSQLTGQYTNVASYVATDYSTTALVNNLQSQIDQLNEYSSTVSSLTGRIKDVNLREAIAHMGVESLDELKALNHMTDAQLDQYTEMYKTKIAQEANVIATELSTELSTLLGQPVDISEFYMAYRNGIMDTVNEVSTKAGQVGGTNIGVATATGMKSEKVKSASRETGETIVGDVADGLNDEDKLAMVEKNAENILLKIQNVLDPDKGADFKSIGGRIVFEIAKGMDTAREDATILRKAVTDIIDKIQTEFTVRNSTFRSIGMNIVSGIKVGMDNYSPLATSAAATLARNTALSFRNTLGVHSPSRVFMEIGKFLDEGLALGMKQYADLATNEASEIGTGTANAVQNAIQQLSGMLDGSIDVNPVITPTLDLSEINARSAALAGMFNDRQIAVRATADDQQAEMITQLGNILAEQKSTPNITFNQTNNSPKALSNTEIYRRTRNGFSQLVSAIQ